MTIFEKCDEYTSHRTNIEKKYANSTLAEMFLPATDPFQFRTIIDCLQQKYTFIGLLESDMEEIKEALKEFGASNQTADATWYRLQNYLCYHYKIALPQKYNIPELPDFYANIPLNFIISNRNGIINKLNQNGCYTFGDLYILWKSNKKIAGIPDLPESKIKKFIKEIKDNPTLANEQELYAQESRQPKQ